MVRERAHGFACLASLLHYHGEPQRCRLMRTCRAVPDSQLVSVQLPSPQLPTHLSSGSCEFQMSALALLPSWMGPQVQRCCCLR